MIHDPKTLARFTFTELEAIDWCDNNH
jgi:hypothetical protein